MIHFSSLHNTVIPQSYFSRREKSSLKRMVVVGLFRKILGNTDRTLGRRRLQEALEAEKAEKLGMGKGGPGWWMRCDSADLALGSNPAHQGDGERHYYSNRDP